MRHRGVWGHRGEGTQVDSGHPQGPVPQNQGSEARLIPGQGSRRQVILGSWQLGPRYSLTRNIQVEALSSNPSPSSTIHHSPTRNDPLRLLLGPGCCGCGPGPGAHLLQGSAHFLTCNCHSDLIQGTKSRARR